MADSEAGTTRAEQELFSELRRLHVLAGEPSSRAIADGVGGMSHTTVNQVIRGRRVPSWPVLTKIVRQLGGHDDDVRALWNAVRDSGQETENLPTPAASNPEVSVFVSYAHVDDRATYKRIQAFTRDVANTYESLTGMEVGLFLDANSIASGEDWKDRIMLGLSSSSIFLAFLSPAYLRSVHCVQEFWEFAHFLNANSSTRLLIPLLFADESRMERFESDAVWLQSTRLQRIDISRLRFEQPGSTLWLERVDEVAARIDDVLTDIAKKPEGRPEEEVERVADIESLDILGKVAKFEEVSPSALNTLSELTRLMEHFGKTISTAGPLMNRATTTKGKLKVSRQLAKQLQPTADSIMASARSLRDYMGTWDETVRAMIEYARRYPKSAGAQKETLEAITATYEMASVGVSSFSDLDQLHEVFGQGRGLTAELDRPLRKTQDALIVIGDIRGLFVGWKEGIEGLEIFELRLS